MDKLKSIKEEMKQFLKESIVEHKIKVGDLAKSEQKEAMLRYIDRGLRQLLRQNRLELQPEQLSALKEEIITEVSRVSRLLIVFGLLVYFQ